MIQICFEITFHLMNGHICCHIARNHAMPWKRKRIFKIGNIGIVLKLIQFI